jgi:hypothetical protein
MVDAMTGEYSYETAPCSSSYRRAKKMTLHQRGVACPEASAGPTERPGTRDSERDYQAP